MARQKKKSEKPKELSKFRKIVHILKGKDVSEKDVFNSSSYITGTTPVSNWDEEDEYSFDIAHRFYNGDIVSMGDNNEASPMKEGEKVIRLTVNPKDVVGELEIPPKALSLEGLDEKILILKDKADLVSQYHAKRELKGLLECLENRKKYSDYSSFFTQFNTTTMESVEKLTGKYELLIESADIFIPEFPDEAVVIMKEYNKNYKEITGKKSRFKVIATQEDFKDADGKRDPILLAQSPFGFYFDILGAWDKEMLLLSEL